MEEMNTSGDGEIIAEAGGYVAIEAAEGAAITLGDVFIGVGIFLAIAFVVLSFILHNSYQYIRIWNFTQWQLQWFIHFDNSQTMNEGQYMKAPAQFDSNNNIKSYSPIQPLQSKKPSPKSKPVNECSYGDFNLMSSHEFSGIGHVLRLTLVDQNNNNKPVYMGAVLFDIPFSGDNSLAATFNIGSGDDNSLQSWYNAMNGKFKTTAQQATSPDGKITLRCSYDYLSGEHPMPGQSGGGTNEAYYYQSLVVIDQLDLTNGNIDPPTTNVSAAKPGLTGQQHSAEPALGGVQQIMRSVGPKYRMKVAEHIRLNAKK